MQTELSYARFFGPQSQSPQVDEVLHQCVAQKLSLLLSLGPAGVTLSVLPSPRQDRALTLTGRWRSDLLEGNHRSVGALVLAPFMFLIEELTLPDGHLSTLGRGDRSVANLIMRNLFHAACRREQMTFSTTATTADPAVVRGSRDLARNYLWVAKTYLKDQVFDRPDALELILACAHLPLPIFSTPLMESGAADFRRVATQNETAEQQRDQHRAFQQARETALAAYRT